MRVWRLAKERLARQLDGEGNRRTGARWNSPGRGVVYTSVSLSLAVLESLVHTSPDLLPVDLVSVEIDVPDDVSFRKLGLESFPEGWPSGARDDWFRKTGDAWLAQASDLYLIAPSIILPQEMNVMINPTHPEIGRVRVMEVRPFRLDPRLIR